MNPNPANCFDIQHRLVRVGGLIALRLELELWLFGPAGDRSRHRLRVDTGADVSMLAEPVAVALGLRLDPWPSGQSPRTATGSAMRCRLARAVRYEFDRLAGVRFRTDFAVSPDLKGRDGLLAWRDLALDFDIRTTVLPQPATTGSAVVGLPGIVRFCLRADRSPDRVG